jgi:hypothetical protein
MLTSRQVSILFYYYYKFFIRIYSLWGGFVVTIPISLILYIIYNAPSSLGIHP